MALFKNSENFFAGVLRTMAVKNADYAAPDETQNEYFNFDVTGLIHGLTPQQVISTEITKKAIRLANLLKTQRTAVGEPVEDTLRDIVGYAAILQSLLEDEAAKAQEDVTVEDDPTLTPLFKTEPKLPNWLNNIKDKFKTNA